MTRWQVSHVRIGESRDCADCVALCDNISVNLVKYSLLKVSCVNLDLLIDNKRNLHARWKLRGSRSWRICARIRPFCGTQLMTALDPPGLRLIRSWWHPLWASWPDGGNIYWLTQWATVARFSTWKVCVGGIWLRKRFSFTWSSFIRFFVGRRIMISSQAAATRIVFPSAKGQKSERDGCRSMTCHFLPPPCQRWPTLN